MEANNSTMMQSESDDTRPYRYISEIDRLRMLREIYKEETQRITDELKSQVEKENDEELRQAVKAKALLDHSKTILQQLDEERKATGTMLSQSVTHMRTLTENMRKNQQQRKETIGATERSIRQLLEELKR